MTLTRLFLAVPIFAAGVAFGNPLFEKRAVCKADNCYRGITQTSTVYKPSVSVRLADCSNFMTTTVTPQQTTITVTNTVATVTTTPGPNLNRRDPITSTGTQPAYATWCVNLSAYSSGCSCAGFTAATITAATPSTTVTVSATVTSTAVPTSCGNEGLQYAIYPNNLANAGGGYTNYNPIVFKSQSPQATGVTTSVAISGYQGYFATVYDTPNVDGGFRAVSHRGYLYATQSGTYTFTASADDIVDIWLGSLAYSGWTRSNTFLEYNFGSNPPTVVTQVLQAGSFYPLRILYANGQQAGLLTLTITAPDGTVVLGGSTGASQSIVQFSCDGVTAPAYAPFGSES